MPYSGGTYSVPSSPGAFNPAVSGQQATPAAWNALLADLSAALSTCVLKDGTQTITADIPFAGHRLTGVGNATAASDAANITQVQNAAGIYAADSGVADAYVLAPTPAVAAYVVGQVFRGTVAHANATPTPTLNVSGLGAGTITWPDGSALAAGDLPADAVVEFAVAAATPAFHLLTVARGELVTTAIQASLLTTRGDIITRGASAPQRLAMAPVGGFLGTNGTDAAYVAPAAVPAAYSNLKVAVSSDTQLALTADAVTVTDGTYFQALKAVNKTLDISTTGANGLDTGTVANDTWYNVFAIAKSDGTIAGLFSASATAPTMPSGYTFKARLGAVRTDGSAHLYRTLQYGPRTQYVIGTNPTVSRAMITGASGDISIPTWTAQSVGAFVPPTASRIQMTLAVDSQAAMAAPNNSYGAYNSATVPPPLMLSLAGSTGRISDWLILESSNVYYASNGGNAQLFCLGWEDNL